MAEVVLCYGKSGSGKSRSLKNFGPEEIYLVNITGKRLPFKSAFKYVTSGDDLAKIKKGLLKMPCNIAVIDDAGYIMSNHFMRSHAAPKKGASSFDMYNDIADEFWDLITFCKAELPPEKIVFILMHEETSDYGQTKLLTIGKLLDQKVCIEGMCTVVLRCCTEGKNHFFATQTDGSDITKSPEGMFESDRIENDLKAVADAITEFYKDDFVLDVPAKEE